MKYAQGSAHQPSPRRPNFHNYRKILIHYGEQIRRLLHLIMYRIIAFSYYRDSLQMKYSLKYSQAKLDLTFLCLHRIVLPQCFQY
jgi:hypothetical protein